MSEIQPIQEISSFKLFDVLQKEYLICILREQIYPIQKHKMYWGKIANMKKDKINDLKWKHKLISIFDDLYILNKYKLQTYNEYGLPNFYYPNERVKDKQIYWDLRNYFSLKSNVKFIDSIGRRREGIIQSCDFKEKLAMIECNDKMNLQYSEVSFEIISRIL